MSYAPNLGTYRGWWAGVAIGLLALALSLGLFLWGLPSQTGTFGTLAAYALFGGLALLLASLPWRAEDRSAPRIAKVGIAVFDVLGWWAIVSSAYGLFFVYSRAAWPLSVQPSQSGNVAVVAALLSGLSLVGASFSFATAARIGGVAGREPLDAGSYRRRCISVAVALAVVAAAGILGWAGFATGSAPVGPIAALLFTAAICALIVIAPGRPQGGGAPTAARVGLLALNLAGLAALLYAARFYLAGLLVPNGRTTGAEIGATVAQRAAAPFIVACLCFAGAALVGWSRQPKPAASPPAPPSDAA